MKILRTLFVTCFVTFFTQPGSSQVSPQFTPLADSFEVSNPNAVQAINIPYDNIDPQKQLFHLFLPNTNGNYPLVVFIHGGGFTGGNPGTVFKDPARRADVKYFLDRGYAFASVGYRLIEANGPDFDGVIKSLSDAKRALQFIRHYAEDLHVDPERVGLKGTSAGAGTGLWIASRSEMANPNDADPVLRESTRVSAVVVGGSQSTYDIYKWETTIYDDFDGQGSNFTLDSIANILTAERLENFYGERLDSLYQIVHDPALIQYRQDVDMLYHLSEDDPPMYINSQSGADHPSDDVLHHSLHGKEIYETALAANVAEVIAHIPAQSIETTGGESDNEFLLRHLGNGISTPEITLGVEPIPEVTIYPNPASNHFKVNALETKVQKVEVLSLSGTVLIDEVNTSNLSQVVTSSLPTGVYLVRVETLNGKTLFRRLVKR